MATDNNRTKTPNDAVKITELPEGSQLLLVDKSGTVLERMEAERFMELVRATVQVGGRNLLRNSAWLNANTEWALYPGVTIDRETTLEGRNSAHIVETGYNEANYYGVASKTDMVKCTPGELFTFSGWVLTKDMASIDQGVRAEIDFYRADGTRCTSISKLLTLTSGEWTRFEYTREAPVDAAKVRVYAYVTKNGNVWFNGFKLERGNTPTDWTPAPEDLGFGGDNLLVDRLLQICAISPESANANNNNSN